MPDTPMTDDELDALRKLANMPGDPIREPRRSHIARYHSALAEAWESGELVRARIAPAMDAEPVAWHSADHQYMTFNPHQAAAHAKHGNPLIPLYAHPATRDLASGQQVRANQTDPRIVNLNAQALAEIKATIDGNSDQPVTGIIYGLLDEISALTPAPDAAQTEATDDPDEAYEMGKRDGYDSAVQDIDVLTGGDGEYRFCTDHDPSRHTPDAEAMKRRIADRFTDTAAPAPGIAEAVRLLRAQAMFAKPSEHSAEEMWMLDRDSLIIGLEEAQEAVRNALRALETRHD